MAQPPIVPRELLVAGYEAARSRFDEAAADAAGHERAFHSLLESVTWLGTIRERLGKSQREPLLEGYWFVRNRMIHEGADTLAEALATPGFQLGAFALGAPILIGSGPVHEWRWKLAAELGRNPRGDVGYHEYAAHLEDRVVQETLEAASVLLGKL